MVVFRRNICANRTGGHPADIFRVVWLDVSEKHLYHWTTHRTFDKGCDLVPLGNVVCNSHDFCLPSLSTFSRLGKQPVIGLNLDSVIASQTSPPQSCLLVDVGTPSNDDQARKFRINISQTKTLSLTRPPRIVSVTGKPLAPVADLPKRVIENGGGIALLRKYLRVRALKFDGAPYQAARRLVRDQEVRLVFRSQANLW